MQMCDTGFTNVLFICFFRPQFLVAVDNCLPASLLNVSVHRAFGRPVLLLAVLTSYIVVACDYLLWSPLITWSPHFHLKLRTIPTTSSLLRGSFLTAAFVALSLHTIHSILRSAFRWEFCSTFFTYSASDMFWRRIVVPGIGMIPWSIFLFLVFGICGPVQSLDNYWNYSAAIRALLGPCTCRLVYSEFWCQVTSDVS